MLHVRCLRDDPGAFVLVLTVTDVDRDVVLLGELDGPSLKDRSAQPRKLEHLVVADPLDLSRVLHDARVSGVNAVDVGEVLAGVGLQHGSAIDLLATCATCVAQATPVGGDGPEVDGEDGACAARRVGFGSEGHREL